MSDRQVIYPGGAVATTTVKHVVQRARRSRAMIEARGEWADEAIYTDPVEAATYHARCVAEAAADGDPDQFRTVQRTTVVTEEVTSA